MLIGDSAHCGTVLAAIDANTQAASIFGEYPDFRLYSKVYTLMSYYILIDDAAPFEVGVLVARANTIASSTFDLTYRLLPCM